ncbi:hypothetical protein QO200_04435 [Flavobacterium sp. Arc3]|jgi:short-subunit dehydrogenase|uniref:hypothetical protein n=1 Tax=Flavobacterium sp. Arc3 TaxID=3046686 RepID=UPI00352F0874
MKRNVLITRTSTGVGFESAILFAQNGYKVYATMRDTKKATDLKKKIKQDDLVIEILPLEVTSI